MKSDKNVQVNADWIFDEKAFKKEFEQQGCVVVRDVFTSDFVKQIKSELNVALNCSSCELPNCSLILFLAAFSSGLFAIIPNPINDG